MASSPKVIRMKRRQLLGLVGGAVAWPLAARGQKIDVRRVGVLMSGMKAILK
jgi:hypothetical protein